MSISSLISEVFRFFKDKWRILLIGAFIFALLTPLVKLAVDQASQTFFVEEETGTSSQSAEDPKESVAYLTEVYSQEPAEFQLTLQKEDGSLFENSFILDEYFSSDEVVAELEQATGVEVQPTLDHEKNLGIYKNAEYRGSIAGIRDRSSNVLTIRVLAATTSEGNLELARYMQAMFENGEIPFLEKLTYIPLSEAQLTEHLVDEDLDMVASPAALGTYSTGSDDVGVTDILLYAGIGFIVGLLVVAVLLLIIQIFRNKIEYAFQYSWGREDIHILVDSEDQDPDLFIHQPHLTDRIVLSPNEEAEIVPPVDEVVLVIESGQTTRTWYNDHYRLAELAKCPIKIVHVY